MNNSPQFSGIIPENQINTSSKFNKFIYFLIFFIIPIIIITLVIINFISKDAQYKKLKFPPYDFKKSNSSGSKQGIIPDGSTSLPGCTKAGGVEKCGCPILHFDKSDHSDKSSGCPSTFSSDLKKGCGKDSTLYQQMMACYNVRNCKFEKNTLSHNKCIQASPIQCPHMDSSLDLNQQKNLCDAGDKSIKSLKSKNPNNPKGCKFNKNTFGNTCDIVK